MKTTDLSVKRDRVGVLASTIVKELATARVNEIRKEDVTVPDKPIAMTPALAAALKQYAVGTAMRNKASDVAEKAGYVMHQGYDGAKPYLSHRYSDQRERRAEKERVKNERMNKVRELRTTTLIDLVTLDPAQAKAVVEKFRKAVEAI